MKLTSTLKKGIFLFLAGISIVFYSNAQNQYHQKLDCFSIIVGKNASVDGSVIFAHNEDTGLKLVNQYKVPARKHNKGETIDLENGGKLEQVTETTGYLWLNIPGSSVCDTYLNEFGVAIGSDGCPSREKNPQLEEGGIVFWLRRAVAERAHSAKEGVKIAGSLINKFGYASSGRTYVIADPNEGWMLAVVNGKHWVAQRVPDDKVAVIPNYYTIGEIDLTDTVNFLGSPDIIDYAIKNDWYNPATDGKFHFAKAYAKQGALTHPGNYKRMWRGVSLVSGKEFDLNGEFPFAVQPEKKVSFQDIMAILRDHYEGTELDKSENYTLGSPYKMNGPTICAKSTQYSVVAQLRSWLPSEIGAVMWLAPYRPDVQTYSPWYSGVTHVPENAGFGDYKIAIGQQFSPSEKTFNRNSAHIFWRYVSVVELTDENYVAFAPQFQKVWAKTEQKMFRNQEKFEKRILKIYKQNPGKARELLTSYSSKKAEKIGEKIIHLTEK